MKVKKIKGFVSLIVSAALSVTAASSGAALTAAAEDNNIFKGQALSVASNHITKSSEAPLTNAVDGEISPSSRTYFYTDYAGETPVYVISLDGKYSLGMLGIYDWADDNTDIRYEKTTIEVSTDAAEWTKVVDTSDNSNVECYWKSHINKAEYDLGNVEAAYVRISLSEVAGKGHPSIIEFTCTGAFKEAIPQYVYNLNFNDSGSVSPLNWAVSPTSSATAKDSLKDDSSLKVTMSNAHSTGFARLDSSHASTFADIDVLWYELSFKYDEGFVAFAPENANGMALFCIDNDGYFKKFAWNFFGDPNGYGTQLAKLKLGEWYHVVASLDFTDADTTAASGAELKIWLNGELIESGDRNSNFKPSSSFSYTRWRVDKPSSGSSTLWLDNFKCFETAKPNTAYAGEAFDAIALTDAYTGDRCTIDGSTAIVPEGTTVTEFKSAFSADGTIIAAKNGSVLSDSDEIDAATDIYVSNELVRKYAVAYAYTALAANDGNGTAEVSQDGNSATFTATAKDGYTFDGWYDGDAKVSGENPYTVTLTADTTLTAKFTKNPAAPVTATSEVSDAAGDGTYRVGLKFNDVVNPSDYKYIVFNAGSETKGGEVTDVLGSSIDGSAIIAIIVENAPASTVKAMFTNADIGIE